MPGSRNHDDEMNTGAKWIVSDETHLGGKPRVRGTRISITFLLECLAAGMSIREVAENYPSLTESSIRGALLELAQRDQKAA